MINLNYKKLLASAALVLCTLSPVYAQHPASDDVEAPRVVAVATAERPLPADIAVSKSQPVAYNMAARDKGFLGVLQEGLSHILPKIGKNVKKISPTGYDNYFAVAEKADAKVAEAMTNNPDANLYAELVKNSAEPAKVVITEFAIPAYTKAVELATGSVLSVVKWVFSIFGK